MVIGFSLSHMPVTCRRAAKGFGGSKMAVESSVFVCLSTCALDPHEASVEGKPDVGAGLAL